MSIDSIKNGVYYLLDSQEVEDKIKESLLEKRAMYQKLSKEELAPIIAQQVRNYVENYLMRRFEANSSESLTSILQSYLTSKNFKQLINRVTPLEGKVLTEIKPSDHQTPKPRPVSEINQSAILLPDGLCPQLGTQILQELQSCDRADWLVSFIKHKAILAFYPALEAFCNRCPLPNGQPRLRIATTTYMGATDAKAMQLLFQLPNTEIRMSYDGLDTRLHAKAYLFHRDTRFSTAYVGSANLSSQAMTTGLEWTVKIAESEMPHLWDRAVYSFNHCWDDTTHFEPCTRDDLDKIKRALTYANPINKKSKSNDSSLPPFELRPHKYQEVVLEDIERERLANRYRHLVVAATGTGKTVMAAFDYAHLCSKDNGNHPNMLFIAHRVDILRQSARTYRMVLRDMDFGEVISDGEQITIGNHIFCTPQTWQSAIKNQYPASHFKAIIIDECHHTPADTFRKLVNYYAPYVDRGEADLLGLTATPDREDGQSIQELFGGKFTHEISLTDAINHNHLVPFDYFAVSDANVDYSKVNWSERKKAESDVQKLLEHNLARAENVLSEVDRYVTEPRKMRAIGFCAGRAHAKFMQEMFIKANIPAGYLEGTSSHEERKATIDNLENQEAPNHINIIFVADLFNEGVDIPSVDTILMLRPTDSAVIFTQQLGRGLRKSPTTGKKSLFVLDFVSAQGDRFNDARKFSVLSSRKSGVVGMRDQISRDMPFLPIGCSVTLSKTAKEAVLKNLASYIKTLRGKRLLAMLTDMVKKDGRPCTFTSFMKELDISRPEPLIKEHITPQRIRELAANIQKDVDYKAVSDFMLRIAESSDDPNEINDWITDLNQPAPTPSKDHEHLVRRFNFITSQDIAHNKVSNADQAWANLWQDIGMKNDILELLRWKSSVSLPRCNQSFSGINGLKLHHRYTRTQITAALGHNGHVPMGGCSLSKDGKYMALFVTRHKSESEFSPTTMYKDYAITRELFEWDSPAKLKVESKNGQDYIKERVTPLLFIQETKKDEYGAPRSFVFLGALRYVSHEHECPIHFRWKLEHSMPAEVFQWAQ